MQSHRIIFLIILFPFYTFSQNQEKIDSLLSVYNNHSIDTIGVKTLHALFDQYMYVSWEKALDYAQKEYDLAQKLDFKEGMGKGYLHKGMSYYFLDKIDSTRLYFDKALTIFNEIEAYFLIATTNRNYSIIEYENGNYNKSIAILDRSISLFKNKLNDSIGLGISYETKSKVYISKGNYKLALQNALSSLRILEKGDNAFNHANALYNMGYVEFFNKNYQKSISYHQQALKMYQDENQTWWAAQAYNDLGNNYFYLNQFSKAEQNLKSAIKLSKEVDAKWIECSSLGALGKIRLAQEKYNDAEKYFKQSLAIANDQNITMKIVEGLNHMAEVNLEKQKFNAAVTYLNKSVFIADSIGAKDQLKTAFDLRAKSHSNLGNFKSAFKDYENLLSINDSILNEKKQQQIEELKTIYETEKKEAAISLQEEEIKTLNQKVEISNLRKGLYAGGMFSFIAISGLVFFGFRQRIKKNKIEREKQDEIYKQEIEHKKNELTSQTLHLVQKNTFIQELQENLERLKNNPELFKMEFKRIVMLLRKENASDKDWEVFKSYFVEVNNDFDKKLQSIYPEISEKETRLAALLKMNLSTKEIATMLNVLPDSILKSKYRLKKKLGLNKEIDLYQYLSTL